MEYNPLFNMQQIILHGPPSSKKQTTVRNYLDSQGFPCTPKFEFRLNSNNYIHARHIKNNFGTLLEFHWKDVFCNENILFSSLFEILQNCYSLSQSISILVCYNIELCSNFKSYQFLYKCIDKYPSVKVILTTTSLSPLPYSLIHRCQTIRFSSTTPFTPINVSNININNVRTEIHKLLINNFDYNNCIYSLLHHFLPFTSSQKLLTLKATECSNSCVNNEYNVQYILEHFVFFAFSIMTP